MKINYVICQLCQKQFQKISGTHLKNHNITGKEYYDRFLKKPDEGKCLNCGKPTNFLKISQGYNRYCSCKCSQVVEETKQKRIETCLKIYGTENVFQNEDIKIKLRNTCKNKYGVDHFTKTDEYIEKTKQTCLEKYGTEYYTKTLEYKEQVKQTCLEKYGTEYISQTEYFKNKVKETCLSKYGVEYISQTDEFKNKVKETCLNKYGVEYFSQTADWSEKTKATLLSHYGVENPSQHIDIHRRQTRKYTAPNNKKYDSSWEYLYEQYLIENSIPHIYQSPIICKWYDIDGKEHIYIPDFYVEGHLVEIKGEQFFNDNDELINPYNKSEKAQMNAKLKYKCMIDNHVIILRGIDLKNLGIKI